MNQKDKIIDLVKRWINKADKDLLTAERELTFEDPVIEAVCFHSQQAVEKYLKAFLVLHQIYFTKTHSIIELLELCSGVDPAFKNELKNADSLTDYAVEIRYPDVWAESEIGDAKEALEIAKKVKVFVSNKIKMLDNIS